VKVPRDLNAQAANGFFQKARELYNNPTPIERVVQRLGNLKSLTGYNTAEIQQIQEALLKPVGTTAYSALKVLTGVASTALIAAYLHYKTVYVPAFRDQYLKNWKKRYPREKEEILNAMELASESQAKADLQARVQSQQRALEQDLEQPVYISEQAEELSKKLKAYLELKENVLNLPRKEAGEEGLARMRAKKGPRNAVPGPHGGWMNDGEECCGPESNPVPFSGLDPPKDGFEWKCSMHRDGNFKWTEIPMAPPAQPRNAGGAGGAGGAANDADIQYDEEEDEEEEGGDGAADIQYIPVGIRVGARLKGKKSAVDAIVDAFLAKRLAAQQLK